MRYLGKCDSKAPAGRPGAPAAHVALFLRTAEFLWQEGHTAHATEQEAIDETQMIVELYAQFAREYMAMPVVVGRKSESERFAGAVDTLCIEALMQDGKALQAGTSHFLGQNFAKAFDVQFANKEGGLDYVWATSWGVSTRLMGSLIMTHSDNHGLILPPKLAPYHVVMVPIFKTEEEHTQLLDRMYELKKELEDAGLSVKVDDRDNLRPGFKFAEWELKGVPARIVIGPRDLAAGVVELARRDTLTKKSVPQEGLVERLLALMDDIQENIYAKALKFREENTVKVDTWDEFKEKIEEGGFLLCHWDGTAETEAKIKEETKATIRCIPLDSFVCKEEGKCIYSGKPSSERVIFARAY